MDEERNCFSVEWEDEQLHQIGRRIVLAGGERKGCPKVVARSGGSVTPLYLEDGVITFSSIL